jgi:predicted aspartyl protease
MRADKYQAALKVSANLESAQVGLVLSLLAEEKPDEALKVVVTSIGAHPDSASLFAAMGDVKFRQGEMSESDQAYIVALQIDPRNVKAYVGLSHLYNAYSLYGHAYAALNKAHDIAPNDPDVQLLWLETLPRRERIAPLRTYLLASHPETQEDRKSLEAYLHYLEKTADQPPHTCKLGTSAEHPSANLEFLGHITHISGVGLEAKVNDRRQLLLLDSGASGITISRKSAEKAGLKPINDISVSIGGIGDKGVRSGYLALADRILIGGLEFHDCVVTVADKKLLPELDGLIGTDVFASYLVDLDLPKKLLRLLALPTRPGETITTAALNTEDEVQNKPGNMDVAGAAPKESFQPPKDGYIAPEMSNWTRFFRFDHLILVPTQINSARPMLFMVDTGADSNTLSTKAAQMTTKVHLNPDVEIRGVSGSVDNVYRAEQVNIKFGRFHQAGQNLDAINLSNLSQSVGTEISGMLGYRLLSMLEIKIDYRDGLIDFVYKDSHGVSH